MLHCKNFKKKGKEKKERKQNCIRRWFHNILEGTQNCFSDIEQCEGAALLWKFWNSL